MTLPLTYADIDETQIDIRGKNIEDDDELRLLWGRELLQARNMFEYYDGWLKDGKTQMDRYRGDVFTDQQRATLQNVEDKYPVEPRVMKTPIMTLVGQILNARRSGQVTTEGGSLDEPAASAERVEVASLLLKDMERKFRERRLTQDMLHDALVSTYPTWLWVERMPEDDRHEGKLRAFLLPWDSTACGPFNWRYMEDIQEFCFVDYKKQAELVRMHPEQADVIKKHRADLKNKDGELLNSIKHWDGGNLSADDRSRLYYHLSRGIDSVLSPSGYYEVYTRVFQVYKDQSIAVNLLNPDDIIVRTDYMDDDEWEEVKAVNGQLKNTEYEDGERNIKILWVTRVTSCGLVLENRMSWFQRNGQLPGVPYVPHMVDGKPTGPGQDMADLTLRVAVAETEFLDAVRKAGKLLVLRAGYLENVDAIPREVSKSVGVAVVKREAPIDLKNIVQSVDLKAQTEYGEYAQKLKNDIETETRINSSMQGAYQPNQANVTKETEIAQGMVVQSIYINNVNEWWEAWQNLKCKLIPYGYDEYDIVEVTDEETEDTQRAEVNVPQRNLQGDIVSVANDMTSVEFKWKIMPVDDSPAAKMQQWQQAIIFWNAAPGPMMQADPTGKLLARSMLAQPNRILKDAGRLMLDDAESKDQQQQQLEQQKVDLEREEKMGKLKNEAEKLKRQGINLSFSGENLVQFPQLAEFLAKMGYFDVAKAIGPLDQQQGAAQPTQQPTQPIQPTQPSEV